MTHMSREETADRKETAILHTNPIRPPLQLDHSRDHSHDLYLSHDQCISLRPEPLQLIAFPHILLPLSQSQPPDPSHTQRHPFTRALMPTQILIQILVTILILLRAHTLHPPAVTPLRVPAQAIPHREALTHLRARATHHHLRAIRHPVLVIHHLPIPELYLAQVIPPGLHRRQVPPCPRIDLYNQPNQYPIQIEESVFRSPASECPATTSPRMAPRPQPVVSVPPPTPEHPGSHWELSTVKWPVESNTTKTIDLIHNIFSLNFKLYFNQTFSINHCFNQSNNYYN
jgi:hypothetical protein